QTVRQPDRLMQIGRHLGVQSEVQNQFFRCSGQTGKVGVRRQQLSRVDRKFAGLDLLLGLLLLRRSKNRVGHAICDRLCPSYKGFNIVACWALCLQEPLQEKRDQRPALPSTAHNGTLRFLSSFAMRWIALSALARSNCDVDLLKTLVASSYMRRSEL